MEISRSGSGNRQTLVVEGKLDAYWSDALSKELDVAVREGAEYVTLDLAAVDFISSAGLRVLLIYLKQLRAINGALRVVNPSSQVQSILDLSGLTELLLTVEIPDEQSKPQSEEHDGENALFEIHDLQARGELSYEFFNPEADSVYLPASSTGYPSQTFGLGVGAFGEKADSARDRFGEYVAASGIIACMPTDGRGHAGHHRLHADGRSWTCGLHAGGRRVRAHGDGAARTAFQRGIPQTHPFHGTRACAFHHHVGPGA
jgi:anti-anti-sigma factor